MPDLQCVLDRIDRLRESQDDKIDAFRKEFMAVSTEWIGVCQVGGHRITVLEKTAKEQLAMIESVRGRVDVIERNHFAEDKQLKTVAKIGAGVWALFASLVVAGWELYKHFAEIVALTISPK
ncbi:MAG TPA: hypothetical protein VMJ73_12120 [Rhizomicrobium sp.]|nr:hypothetical protein [Rhizomicrobium sp.]